MVTDSSPFPVQVTVSVAWAAVVPNRVTHMTAAKVKPRKLRFIFPPFLAGGLGRRNYTPSVKWLTTSSGEKVLVRPLSRPVSWTPSMVTIEGVRKLALSLPRSYEALVRDRLKFRVDRIVYLAFSRDESLMGFAFPKEEREALVASEPDKFLMPKQSDMRYHWVEVRLDAIDDAEMREIVIDAWRMVVPKRVAAEHLGEAP